MVGDQGQMLPLLAVHVFRSREIPHMDDVRLEQLATALLRIAVHDDGGERAELQLGEAVRNETHAAKKSIDDAKWRLPTVERHERHFGLDRDRARERSPPGLEDIEL